MPVLFFIAKIAGAAYSLVSIPDTYSKVKNFFKRKKPTPEREQPRKD